MWFNPHILYTFLKTCCTKKHVDPTFHLHYNCSFHQSVPNSLYFCQSCTLFQLCTRNLLDVYWLFFPASCKKHVSLLIIIFITCFCNLMCLYFHSHHIRKINHNWNEHESKENIQCLLYVDSLHPQRIFCCNKPCPVLSLVTDYEHIIS